MQYKHAQILEFLSTYIVLNYPSRTLSKSKWSSLSVSLPALTLCTSCSALAALGSCKWRRKSNSLFNSSTYGGKCSNIKLPFLYLGHVVQRLIGSENPGLVSTTGHNYALFRVHGFWTIQPQWITFLGVSVREISNKLLTKQQKKEMH